MALKRQRKARDQEEASEIPMTPMIDVVFQLLIYFLVTLEPEDVKTHLEVLRPSPESQQEESDVPDNLMQIEVFDNGYTINEKRVDLEGLSNVLATMANLDKEMTILIMCTAQSQHERLVKVLDRCAQYDLKNLSVISTN